MDKLRIASANTERPATKAQAHDACCAHDAPAHGPTTDGKGQAHDHSTTPVQAAPIGKGWTRYRVATMDCAAEESEIRRAVDGIAGIRERLAALYGSSASLTLRRHDDAASEAVLQFPLEGAETRGSGT